jgi:Xaa-Pro aminopeptidase
MSEFGFMGVDWEERIDFDRLRRERLQKAKEALEKSDLNALFIFRLEDVRYLTGYRCHLGPVTKLDLASVILPRGGDPILFTLDQDHSKTRMPWLDPNMIFRRPNVRHGGGATKWAEHVKSLIGNLTEGKIGIDAWSISTEHALKEAFPKAEFVDGYKVLMEAKMIKTKDELECQRAAAMITEAGMHAALKALEPGVKECELLSIAWQTFTAMGSEWTQCANIVTSGPSTAPYRRFTSDRVIRMGDLVILDIGACFNGYWGDITRTWVCGDVMPT